MSEEQDIPAEFADIRVHVDEDGKHLYGIHVSDGREVVMRELSVEKFGACLEQGGGDWTIVNRGVRMALVSDRGEPLKMSDTAGAKLGQRFRVRELGILRQLWEHLHMPNEAQIRSIRELRVG